MTKNPTELALLARGMDTRLAQALRLMGWTLSKLQQCDVAALEALSIDQPTIVRLHKGKRPPIPPESLVQVLFASRWLCCVCRDPTRPVVVHHIQPWAKSRDHSPANLAVLCTLHHGEAHSQRGLEVTLSAERLLAAKLAWERQAAEMDRLAIHQSTQVQACHWWYFNHLRLFELTKTCGVDLQRLPGFAEARQHGLCAAAGVVELDERGRSPYTAKSAHHLYQYMVQMLSSVLEHTVPRNISDDLDRGTLPALITSGDIIFVQGRHFFSSIDTADPREDLVRARRSANKVDIQFVFNRHEGTSGSARALWLCGAQTLCSVLQVTRIERADTRYQIYATVLAIRSAHGELKSRLYEGNLLRYGLGVGAVDDSEE
ncbi:HNH endonuclease signature motif containing protein [Pseudomonas monteilii]|uniref:HNH endonuclease signature motif containing protein n=1 Tax=Pseudomonas monteilii TaxID=76759 RepID=UPI002CB0E9E7|nr:HNH endonuclease signature motif containing protein [Hyphomicrobiales bacterium]